MPELAKFQFRATNRWITGTHSQSTIDGFFGAGQEMTARADVHLRRRPPGGAGRRATTARRRRVPAARPGLLPDRWPGKHRRRPRRQPRPRSPRPSKATSTCSASSGCPTRSATATSRSRSPSTSRATTPRSSPASSSSRAAFGCLRRADQRRASVHRRRHRLTATTATGHHWFGGTPTCTRNPPTIDSAYDVVVVGARVAGAATAMLLARFGLRVIARRSRRITAPIRRRRTR